MKTDYRKLCLELFGTDQEQELRQIAKKVQQKNARNAGRKKKYSEAEAAEMRRLREEGMSLQKIADRYGTSRQVIGRYLTSDIHPDCTMRMIYMYQTQPCTVIDVDFLNQKVYIQNHTLDLLHRAFGPIEKPTWQDFEQFLADRCFPETRGDQKQLLQALGLTDYDPLQIVEKTQGRTTDDALWLKIRYWERGNQHEIH